MRFVQVTTSHAMHYGPTKPDARVSWGPCRKYVCTGTLFSTVTLVRGGCGTSLQVSVLANSPGHRTRRLESPRTMGISRKFRIPQALSSFEDKYFSLETRA